MEGAHFTVERKNSIQLVRLRGQLRVDVVPAVSEALFETLSGERPVVVDLSDLRYIDSAGIAMLVALYKRLHRNDSGRLVLCGAREDIWGVFRTMKLDGLFELFSTAQEAQAAVHHVDTTGT